jgi:hypothetical protein
MMLVNAAVYTSVLVEHREVLQHDGQFRKMRILYTTKQQLACEKLISMCEEVLPNVRTPLQVEDHLELIWTSYGAKGR